MDAQRNHNPYFPLTVFFSAAFIVTVLALIAVVYGDPRAPINAVLDRYGGWALGGEFLGIFICGFLALAVDRRQTLAGAPDPSDPRPSESTHGQEHPGGDRASP